MSQTHTDAVADSRTTAICVFTPHTGAQADLQHLVLPLVEPSRREPGCLGYDFYQEEGGPLVRVEQWATREAFDVHCAQPRVVEVFEHEILELLDREPEVHVTTPITAADH
ncbi:antibiotic biosynthesis monooxygenase [Kocuria sp. JC486]|uniref:putative quinol monooxygenase n=1 Tax=Kocuria sp. JC486 TaxID=1970736 RepID=UPI00141FD989|nr:putative quinol monooxygenase [Kocuria sp. JC486]NHU84351.1 antibiotic biosynthesis monooxygenase [Kocuria sp. JC486]